MDQSMNLTFYRNKERHILAGDRVKKREERWKEDSSETFHTLSFEDI